MRLFRPYIPLKIRCQVAERQMDQAVHCLPTNEHGVIYRDLPAKSYRMQDRLDAALFHLARILGCEVPELRLDHDPPLAARAKSKWSTDGKTHYIPQANDPNFLNYRPHGPQHDGSHLIKTNVRGDHGQHPDRVLIKKARRAERGPKPKHRSRFSRPTGRSKKSTLHKRPWPKRKFESRRKSR